MNSVEAKILLKQFKANDKDAINKLYEMFSRKLYNFAFSYLKTEEDALDVVQTVFVNLWDKRKNISDDSNLESYLFTVTKNAVISTFRKKVQEKKYLENLRQTTVLSYNDTDEKYDYEILYEKIQKLIEELPEKRRHIFKLYKEEGLSNKEIAEKLNISVKTVEDHKTKAKHFIKNNLEKSGFIALLLFEVFL
ncbi:RNA polymerase sigma-70 factor [Mariniphaga sediminis]|uniref:RNA polymerase sigma-70 factor n=1 Tax=Mariniphaga sediminis TaxID=1628158 RepID=A0A399CYT1_9BACT|nr:RNA polymerase sigma-70 factor [Mariniphaga sediminis]RIH64589.1 RNA polymerase sigma-70 factor [Mariniphaga sediminis]